MKNKLIFLGGLSLAIVIFFNVFKYVNFTDDVVNFLAFGYLVILLAWTYCLIDVVITGIQNYILTK